MVTFTREYEQLVKVISALLYAFDPDGMGLTVGSPTDEYDDPAGRLVLALSKASGRDAAAVSLRAVYPDAPDILYDAVLSVFDLYAKARDSRVD